MPTTTTTLAARLRRLRPILGAFALGAALLAATPAHAQRGGGWGGQFQRDFVRRDVPVFERELDLDEDQVRILEVLLLEYEAAFEEALDVSREAFQDAMPNREAWREGREERRALREEMREIGRELRAARQTMEEGGEPDKALLAKHEERMAELRQQMEQLRPRMPEGEEFEQFMERMRELGDEWAGERDALRRQFVADVNAILSEDQQAYWPVLERTIRRERSLRRGRLSGESVDLFHVLRDGDLDVVEMELEQLMSQYEIDLDRALVARDDVLDDMRVDFMEAMRTRDVERAMDVARRSSDLRVAVRDVNVRYADLVAAALPDEAAASFRGAWRERAFERVFSPTPMSRSFAAAREMELDEETMAVVVAMQETYDQELAAKNEDLVRVTIRHEPEQTTSRVRRMAARMAGEEAPETDDPVREAFESRREMDARYRSQLEALLTPEQVAQLPDMRGPREREGWRGRGGGGDRERAERRERMRARAIERFDRDGDGKLSEEEMEEARQQRFDNRRDGGRDRDRGDDR